MDQGLSAVLGAAVGVMGTAISGALGYIAARRQAPDQGRMEHARTLRSERRETYLEFMKWMQPAHDFGNVESSDETREWLETMHRSLTEAQQRLHALQPRMDLAGPREVSRCAGQVWMETYELAIAVERKLQGVAGSGELSERWWTFVAARDRFVGAVNVVLGEPPK